MRYNRRCWTFARWIRLPRILMDALPRPMLVPEGQWEILDSQRRDMGMTWPEFWEYAAKLAREQGK